MNPSLPSRMAILDYSGPMDWQILQQNDHSADISFSGRLHIPAEEPQRGLYRPIARLVREDSSRPVTSETGWTRCTGFDFSSGQFEHRFSPIPAGGLYRLEIGATLNDRFSPLKILQVVHMLGVGDLWVLAGQSNSAGIGRGVIDDPPQLGVHGLMNNERWSLAMHPLNDQTGSTHPNAEGYPYHSPHLAFAKTLQRELGYPIGLIQTALGGSPLSAWNPDESGNLYRNMLHCIQLAGGKVKGLLWYQGESDTPAELADTYTSRFIRFIEATRSDLNLPNLPVITTQLNRVEASPLPETALNWSRMREIQRMMPRHIPHLAVVPALGLSMSDGIHTSTAGNLELGHRYADTALGMVYGRAVHWRFPEPEKAWQTGEQTLCIQFASVSSILVCITGTLQDFRVEDELGRLDIKSFSAETADQLTLTLNRPMGSQVRISSAWGTNPEPSLYDMHEHRPVLAFTDFPVTRTNSA